MENDDHVLRAHLPTEAVQPRQEAQAEADLTEATQYTDETSPSADTNTEQIPINHPAAFSFPTLSPDGSVDDIRTPPAALSSLGARLRMAEKDAMSDSTSSFDDSQYDMIDDRSEASNDDHETASVASTERDASEDGSQTPEYAGSIAGDDQEEEDVTPFAATTGNISDSVGDLADRQEITEAQRPEEKIDSLDTTLSGDILEPDESDDELETPRQSTLSAADPRPTSRRLPPTLQSKQQTLPTKGTPERPLRVLFISERSVSETKKYDICTKITSGLAGSKVASQCQISKLPPTPSGISPSSAVIFRDGDVELSVQHCIGADDKEGPENHSRKYALHILDADGEYSSVYTIGGQRKPDFEAPDLAVIYCSDDPWRTAGLHTADSAMRSLEVPVMVVSEGDRHRLYGIKDRDIESVELLEMDNSSLHTRLTALIDTTVPDDKTVKHKPKTGSVTKKFKGKYRSSIMITSVRYILQVIIAVYFAFVVAPGIWPSLMDPVAETAIRREALTSALVKMTNCTDATKTFNIEHLVPSPNATSTNFMGQPAYSMPYASYYQGASPNHVIVSLTKKPGNLFYPSPKLVYVSKSGRNVEFNQTTLIRGIYDIMIDPTEAHGLVNVHMLTKNPSMNFSMQYNFGNRMLLRKTYERAGTDISKSVNKDLTVAGKAVKSLGEKVQLEIAAGAAATKNVTTQLALYVARDVQMFTNTAASLVGKIGQAGNNTAVTIRKDFIAFGNALQRSVSITGQAAKGLVPTKKAVKSPLKLASDRAVGFRQKLFGRQKEVNSTSATKELSTYFQDLLKPGTTAKKPSNLRDIARCLPARDYNACKKAQAKSLSVSSKANLLSTVSAKGLTSQETASGKKPSARDANARQDVKRDRALKVAEGELKSIAREQEIADKRAAKHRAKLEDMEKKVEEKAAKLKQKQV